MDLRLPATSYAVLGMLSLAPMSGYELTQSVDKTIAHFWTISKSQVYGELSRLEELGLVTGNDVEQERLPDKRTYQLTQRGSEELDRWLETASDERTRFRSGQLLKLFFAQRLDRDGLEAFLERYRRDAEAARAQLEAIVALLDGMPEAYFPRATALVGLRNTEGTLSAIDEIRSSMPKKRQKPGSRTVAGAAAKELFHRTPTRRRGA